MAIFRQHDQSENDTVICHDCHDVMKKQFCRYLELSTICCTFAENSD